MDIMIQVLNYVRYVIILVQHALLHPQIVWRIIATGPFYPINVLAKMAFMIMGVRFAFNAI